ncbi:MAG: DUF1254 domain-containing protein [Lentimicrobium sp.]|nr:DUF1254 domain-containing protein [Lentimicrobium sp.]
MAIVHGCLCLYFYICFRLVLTKNLEIMEEEIQYTATYDSNGRSLEGSRNYKFHLPSRIPVRDFWSVILYDKQTHQMIQTGQSWPSVHRQSKNLIMNEDGSIDIYFGSKAPAGLESNWIQTIPGKNWSLVLRLYDPLEPWFEKSWRPGEIDEVI